MAERCLSAHATAGSTVGRADIPHKHANGQGIAYATDPHPVPVRTRAAAAARGRSPQRQRRALARAALRPRMESDRQTERKTGAFEKNRR